jgi:uncharacterized protein HemY
MFATISALVIPFCLFMAVYNLLGLPGWYERWQDNRKERRK